MKKTTRKTHKINRHGRTLCSAENDPNKRFNLLTTEFTDATTCGNCLGVIGKGRPTGFRNRRIFDGPAAWYRHN